MVLLPVEPFPFHGVGHVGILRGVFFVVIDGHLKHTPAAALHDAVKLAQHLAVVFHVFQQVVRHDHIETLILKGDVMTIEMVVCPGTVQIGRHVVQVGLLLESGQVAVFRREVQHAQGRLKEGRLALQKGPHGTVTLQTQAVRSQRIGATADTTVRQHLSVGLPHNGVFQRIAGIRPRHALQCQVCSALKHGARHPPRQNADQSHALKIRRDPWAPP